MRSGIAGILMVILLAGGARAQDTREGKTDSTMISFILPPVMIGYGVVGVHNGELRQINTDVKELIWDDHPHRPFHLDNYLQFGPAASVYVLHFAGVHSRDDLKDFTVIFLLANIFVNGVVQPVKSWSHELRPDRSDYHSFPSGHSAEAFAGAEFMRMEYRDVSPWYGIAGYAMATVTGGLRMYNDKHWLSDVIGGAGVGIASTRMANWLYPKIKRLLSPRPALQLP